MGNELEKLERLEKYDKLETRLGIDFPTFVEVMESGLVHIKDNEKYFFDNVSVDFTSKCFIHKCAISGFLDYIPFGDHLKTWWTLKEMQ